MPLKQYPDDDNTYMSPNYYKHKSFYKSENLNPEYTQPNTQLQTSQNNSEFHDSAEIVAKYKQRQNIRHPLEIFGDEIRKTMKQINFLHVIILLLLIINLVTLLSLNAS